MTSLSDSKSSLTKFRAIIIIAVVLIAIAAGGYSYYSTRPTTSTATGTTAASRPPTTLTIWLQWEIMTDADYANFEKANNVKLERTIIDYTVYREKIISAIVTGTTPDIFWIDGPWLSEFVTKGWVERAPASVSDFVTKNMVDGAIDNSAFKGVIYGVTNPYLSSHVLLYNKAHFRAVGLDPAKPPKSIEELRDYAKKLALWDSSGKLIRAGYLQNIRDFYFGDLLHSSGGSLYSEDDKGELRTIPAKATFNDSIGRNVIGNIAKMYTEDKSADLAWSLGTFQSGNTSMVLAQGPGILKEIYQTNIEVGVAPVPGPTPRSGDGSLIYAVNRYASPQVKELGWKFLMNMIQRNVVLALAKQTWMVPSLRGAMDDPEFQQVISATTKGGKPLPSLVDWYKAGIGTASWTRPKTTHYGYISEVVWTKWIAQLLLGKISLDQFMDGCTREANALLAQGET